MNILIAEDDFTSRSILAMILEKHGYGVAAAADGAEAWAAMQGADAPKLAILDWMMPEMDGIEVCRRIRTLETDQPAYIIMLTAKGEKDDIVAGLEAGADDYLAKPYDPDESRARVGVGRRVVEMQAKLAEARDALAHEATHDPLTGILNRREFSIAWQKSCPVPPAAVRWWVSGCATSTISKRSTTATGIRSATTCCAGSPASFKRTYANAILSAAMAGRSFSS